MDVNAEGYLISSVYHSAIIIIHSSSVVRKKKKKVHYVKFFGVWNKSACDRDETIESPNLRALLPNMHNFIVHCRKNDTNNLNMSHNHAAALNKNCKMS